MTWFDNSGGFKAHKKHWVNKSRREGEEGRGTRWEEGVKGKEGGGRRKEEGGRREERERGGGSSSQTVQSVDYLFSRSLLAASGII